MPLVEACDFEVIHVGREAILLPPVVLNLLWQLVYLSTNSASTFGYATKIFYYVIHFDFLHTLSFSEKLSMRKLN